MGRNPAHRIITHTGREFWPLDPQPEWVDIKDIAHALSNVGRFTGHTHEFYSVAQHSWLVSHRVPTEHALWGLLHDATEAYIADLAKPVKVQFPQYQEVEERLLRCVAAKFNLPWPEPAEVKLVDNRMLATEWRDLMPSRGKSSSHTNGAEPYIERVTAWAPNYAKTLFLERYREITMPAQFRPCVGQCQWEADLEAQSTIRIADDIANRKDL